MTLPNRPYVAPRGLGIREHIDNWAQNAERRFEARSLNGSEQDESGGADLELTLFDVIGVDWYEDSLTAKKVDKALRAAPAAKKIRMLVNSPGGILHEGVAIYNLLKRHPAEIEIEVVGEAASAATIVMMAGDRIIMRPGTISMVHPAWTCACGDETSFLNAAEYCKRSTSNAIDVYMRRTGRTDEELRALVYADKGLGTWMTANETVENGFADEVREGASDIAPAAEDEDADSQEVNVNVRVSSNKARPQQLAFPIASQLSPPPSSMNGIRWALNSSRLRARQ